MKIYIADIYSSAGRSMHLDSDKIGLTPYIRLYKNIERHHFLNHDLITYFSNIIPSKLSPTLTYMHC
jgi:hypothetical protein